MRLAVTFLLLVCLLAGDQASSVQGAYVHPQQLQVVQQAPVEQVEKIQQSDQTQQEQLSRTGEDEVEEVGQEQTQVQKIQQVTGPDEAAVTDIRTLWQQVQQEGGQQTQEVNSDEDGDDLTKDPDWEPTIEDYLTYEEDKLEDYDDGEGEDEDYYPDEDDYEWDEDDEDTLWLSDEDPDWVPEGDEDPDWVPGEDSYQDEDEDGQVVEEGETSQYESLLLQIAKLLQDNAALRPGHIQQDLSVKGIIAELRVLEMSEEEAREVLNNLLVLTAGQQQEANDITQQEDVGQSYSVKGSRLTKRHVKSQYAGQQQGQYQQEEAGLLQEQVIGGYGPGQSQQQQENQGYNYYYGTDQQGQVGGSDLSQGVEQLVPSGGRQQYDLGAGVQPERGDGGEGDETSVFDYIRLGWGLVRKTAESVGDKLEDALEGVDDKIVTAYQDLREDLRRLKEKVLLAFSSFGTVIQDGLGYCIDRIAVTYNKVQGIRVMEKLEQKLEQGNEYVADFFHAIGQKISKWKEQQVAENVDPGLVQHQQQGQTQVESGDIERAIPDLFQDVDVRVHLHKLVEVGVLDQVEMQIITDLDTQQEHQNQQQVQQNQQQVSYQQQQN